MIEPHEYDLMGVEEGYNALMDVLLGSGLNKAEAVVALLNALGTQYAGNLLSDDDARVFVEKASTWIEQYFKDIANESLSNQTPA